MADKQMRLDRERFENIYREHFDRVAAYLLARADRDLAADALSRTLPLAARSMEHSEALADRTLDLFKGPLQSSPPEAPDPLGVRPQRRACTIARSVLMYVHFSAGRRGESLLWATFAALYPVWASRLKIP
jgi:hypothetical protein